MCDDANSILTALPVVILWVLNCPKLLCGQAMLNIIFISMDFSRFRLFCEPWTCKIRKICIKDVVLWFNDSFTILLHFKGFPRKRDLFYDFCAILYDFLENQLLSIVIDWESTWISRKSTKKISIIGEPMLLLS